MEKTLTSTYRNRILVKQAQLAVLTSKYNKAMAAGAAEIDRLARECMARQAMMKRAFVAVKGLSKSAQTAAIADTMNRLSSQRGRLTQGLQNPNASAMATYLDTSRLGQGPMTQMPRPGFGSQPARRTQVPMPSPEQGSMAQMPRPGFGSQQPRQGSIPNNPPRNPLAGAGGGRNGFIYGR